MIRLGDTVDLVVEVPKGSFVKRAPDGSVDYVSPLPCPFNYGCVPGTIAGDGDPADVLLLGSRRERGTHVRARVVGIVDFVDDGCDDPKHVCADDGATAIERVAVHVFFSSFSWCKRVLNRARGRRGATGYRGVSFEASDAPGDVRGGTGR